MWVKQYIVHTWQWTKKEPTKLEANRQYTKSVLTTCWLTMARKCSLPGWRLVATPLPSNTSLSVGFSVILDIFDKRWFMSDDNGTLCMTIIINDWSRWSQIELKNEVDSIGLAFQNGDNYGSNAGYDHNGLSILSMESCGVVCICKQSTPRPTPNLQLCTIKTGLVVPAK